MKLGLGTGGQHVSFHKMPKSPFSALSSLHRFPVLCCKNFLKIMVAQGEKKKKER
jgi:hypothetical protein